MFNTLTLNLTRLLVLVFALSGFTAHADHPIDDNYNVGKYRNIYAESVERLNQARALLERLNVRVNQTAARLDREVRELDQLVRQLEANNSAIANAQSRINQLEQSIRTARQEIQQLNREIPETQRLITEEERRNQHYANQAVPAENEAKRLEAAAKEKSEDARILAQAAAQKRQALEAARSEYATAAARLIKLEQDRAQAQKQIDALQARLNQLAQQLEAQKRAVAQLERESAQDKAKYDDAEAKAVEAEKLADEAERNRAPDARGKRARARALRQQAERAEREYQASSRNLDAARKQVADLEQQLERARVQKAEAEKRAAELDQQIAVARNEAAPYKAKVDAAEREYNEAQALANTSANDARNAQVAADQARRKANELQALFQASERRLVELRQELASRQNRMTALRQAVTNWDREQDVERQNIVQAEQRNRQIGPRIAQQRRQVNEADADYRQAAGDRDQAAHLVATEERHVQMNLARLNQVEENLRAGIAQATDAGVVDGREDGSIEGDRVARIDAELKGREIGEREGRAEGTRQGVEAARQIGRTEGTELGRTEGTEEGAAKGRADGEREGEQNGSAKGTDDGLAQGHDEGYREAFPKGEAEGRKMGDYAKGRTEGYAKGRARGESQGRSEGDAEGRREANAKYLEADLAEVTMPNRLNGTISASFDRPRFENYNPRRNFPQHPMMQKAYLDNYRGSFYDTAAVVYDRVFGPLYDQIRREVHEATRQEYANRDYPEERKGAFDAAYAHAKDLAFKAAEKKAYDEVYGPVFERARLAAFPAAKAEGRRKGLKDGFDEGKAAARKAEFGRGYADGDNAGFQEHFARNKQEAKDRAYDEVVAYYRSNAVLKYEGALLVDANADGIYYPGESFSLALTVKNFGEVAQNKRLVVQLSNATQGLEVEQPEALLVGIPGLTRAVVTDIAALRVSTDARLDSIQSVVATVVYDGKVLEQTQLQLKVGYPYSVAKVEKPSYTTPNQDNVVKVTVRNVSTKPSAQAVTVRLESVDGLARVTAGTANLGVIMPGASRDKERTAELAFQFTEEQANKTLEFEVQVFEGNTLLGSSRFTTDTAKRWSFNPASAGLVLIDSADLAQRSEAVAKAVGLGYDIYDVRVEGQATDTVTLKYTDKSIIIPSVNGSYDGVTSAALQAFLARGGQLLAGVSSSSDRTRVGQVINQMQTMLSSNGMHGSLAVYAANDFRPNEPKALVAEMKDARAMSARDLATLVVEFNAVRKLFSEKISAYLAASASGNQAYVNVARNALVFELFKEMRDNKAVKGNNYKKNKAKLKLTALVNTALSKQGEERKALLSLYPSLKKARDQVEESGWFKSEPIAGVLKPLKKAYEKEILGRKGS